MNELLQRLNEWWSTRAPLTKGLIVGGTAAAVILLVILGQYLGRVEYAPLFQDMETREAGAITEELSALNVPYQLADQGRTILVPAEKVYQLRLTLANNNLIPSGGVGYEIFDQGQLGTTDFQRQINYIRALQEELRRTIVQFDEVEQARVHLVVPEPSVFVREAQPASASVALKLKPMASLSESQVRAIVMLVANSVEGLKPEDVTVVDLAGDLLTKSLLAEGETALSPANLRQQELEMSFEQDLEQRLKEMLEMVFGQGKAVTMVNAALDFSQEQTTTLVFGDPFVISRQTTTENGSGGAGGGVPGDQDLTGSYGTTENQSNYSREEEIVNYEAGRTETTVIEAPGRLVDLSVAVALDGTFDQGQVQQVQQLVAAAVGQPADRIQVLPLAFSAEEASDVTLWEEEMQKAEEEARLRQYISWGLQGLALILAFILGLVLVRRLTSRQPVGGMVDATLGGPTFAETGAAKEAPPKVPSAQQERQKQAKEIVQKKTEESVQLVRAWISEDR